MANTYTQLLVQFVFAVRGRQSLIRDQFKEEVEKYICAVVKSNKSRVLAIYCNPDHCHVLVGLHPSVSISNMAREMKSSSSKWLNTKRLFKGRFSWQRGFGAFTYSKSQMPAVVNYILNQPKHHQKISFQKEYTEFLEKFGIKYDEKYTFHAID